jgi:general stress protein YciG
VLLLNSFHSLDQKFVANPANELGTLISLFLVQPLIYQPKTIFMEENQKGRNGRGTNQDGGHGNGKGKGTSNRGFASMDPEQQRAIARKGGEAVSGNREHMSAIGRKGGEASGGKRNNSRS